MKKTDYKEIKLEKGTIFEYSFGEVKLLFTVQMTLLTMKQLCL